MEKAILNSFISKYSIGGTIESVAWEVNGDTLKTKIVSDNKDLLGEVEMKVKSLDSLDGKKFGIFKTSELVKMINVLNDDIKLKLEFAGEHAKSLKIEDNKGIKMNFPLSDLAIIPPVPLLKSDQMPDKYEVSIKVDEDFINTFTRAKLALPEVVIFTIKTTAKSVELTFGQTDVNTKTITFSAQANEITPIDKIAFATSEFKEILSANKDTEADFLVSSDGIGKLVYNTKEYKATYYLVAKTIG